MKHIFLIYHPAVLLAYILSAIGYAMATAHPVFVLISLVCAISYALYLYGHTYLFRSMKYFIVIFLVVCVANPLFNHKGFTILFKIGNTAFTFEALFYGICTGAMLLAVIIWFQCYQKLITNDRFLYLFGKAAPTASMMVSMILKWIPVTLYKARCIRVANAALQGNGVQTKRQKIRHGVRNAGILMSWSMEDSIETADSMRARGYGSAKRSAFNHYVFGLHDALSLVVILALAAASLTAIIYANGIMFFPVLSKYQMPIYVYIPYLLLLLYPLLLELKERIKWRL